MPVVAAVPVVACDAPPFPDDEDEVVVPLDVVPAVGPCIVIPLVGPGSVPVVRWISLSSAPEVQPK
jgi:hypothetical protein